LTGLQAFFVQAFFVRLNGSIGDDPREAAVNSRYLGRLRGHAR
jgi:hypothetical protein